MSDLLAIDVDCPHCDRPAGYFCTAPFGHFARYHRKRWKAAGVDKPTFDQEQACHDKERELWRQRIRERGKIMSSPNVLTINAPKR